MKLRVIVSVCLFSSVAFAQTAEEAPKSGAREALKARLAEDARKTKPTKAKAPGPPSAPAAAAKIKSPVSAAPAAEAATVLPKVEVKKGRITELDRQLALQDQAIAREKKNLKSSELDNALNDAKLARPLALFGGDSTQFRQGVASERVELMEAEKDIVEAIAHAKAKAEKAALQKQLDELKAMRRELDKSMR
jgi:hypothetical protein